MYGAGLPDWVECLNDVVCFTFQGVKCAKCPEVFHKVCMKKYLQRLKKCPACKHTWTASLQ